jgi:hypothetical protein
MTAPEGSDEKAGGKYGWLLSLSTLDQAAVVPDDAIPLSRHPAQAGIQGDRASLALDPRCRGDNKPGGVICQTIAIVAAQKTGRLRIAACFLRAPGVTGY